MQLCIQLFGTWCKYNRKWTRKTPPPSALADAIAWVLHFLSWLLMVAGWWWLVQRHKWRKDKNAAKIFHFYQRLPDSCRRKGNKMEDGALSVSVNKRSRNTFQLALNKYFRVKLSWKTTKKGSQIPEYNAFIEVKIDFCKNTHRWIEANDIL